ncbi:MAG: hypothetical protein WCA38_02015 [Candidatus Acidiferrales bacterium]
MITVSDVSSVSARIAPPSPLSARVPRRRVFLLSPANASGNRARVILGNAARTELAKRIRGEGAPLGDIFSFISGLYFRGKLVYSRVYANPPEGVPGVFVITAAGGLVSPDRVLTLDELRAITTGNVCETEPSYRSPLVRNGRALCECLGKDCDAVLLGSVATPKYIEPLLSIFGERLLFPAEFVGRGDLSRGGLLLRCAREKVELKYVPVAGSVRSGARPPKLPKVKRAKSDSAK